MTDRSKETLTELRFIGDLLAARDKALDAGMDPIRAAELASTFADDLDDLAADKVWESDQ